jgi:hypothetical protein
LNGNHEQVWLAHLGINTIFDHFGKGHARYRAGKSLQSKFRFSLIWHTKGKAYVSGHDVIRESTEASQQHQSHAQRSVTTCERLFFSCEHSKVMNGKREISVEYHEL